MSIEADDMESAYERAMKPILEKLRLRRPSQPDEQKLHEALRRGQRCKELFEDPDLKQAFAMVEDIYLSAWRLSDITDIDKRERCHIAVNLLTDLRSYLKMCVENGDAARREIAKIANR